MPKEPKLSEEHMALLAEAEELGLSTLGYAVPNAKLDRLRDDIARRTEAIAKEAAAKERMEAAVGGMSEDEEFSEFDEASGTTRGVLVRIVEWSEWMPVKRDDHLKGLTVVNGVTGFEAGEFEKVVSIDTMDTNKHKRVPADDGTDGYTEYSLVVMKAVLANNVSTDLLHNMIDLQGGDREGTMPKAQVILPDAPQPNRRQRRHMN